MRLSAAHTSLVDQIREAFAYGRAAEGETMLGDALDAGLPWDVLTRAVAQGVEQRFGVPHDVPESALALA